MTREACSIDGCGKPLEARGWCQAHYWRWKRHGDPLGGNTCYTSPAESFMARTEWQGDCLMWTGSIVHGGYGQIWANGRKARVHRYAWEAVNGPIPPGMFVDHTCFNRACVNVKHLRLATPSQNEQNRAGTAGRTRTGVRNVYMTRGGRFVVYVKKAGVRYGGSVFDSIDDAALAAETLRSELFGEFAGRPHALAEVGLDRPAEHREAP